MQENTDVYSKDLSTKDLLEQNQTLQKEIEQLKMHYEKLSQVRESLIKFHAQQGRILKRKSNRKNYDD